MKRNEYITKCNTRKTEYYSNKIHEYGNDPRKLYKIVSDLSNMEHKNVYPESNNTQVLTNNFGKFFANKLPT